jgi:fructose-1,6-bisphosphatase/sedoheptulose 1,7-bisphosphatase-like protein
MSDLVQRNLLGLLSHLFLKKDVIFAATGVTDGLLVNGVQKYYDKFTTETLLLSSAQKMSYKVKTTRY